MNAHTKLTQLSQSLMKGMRLFQQHRSQQQQQQLQQQGQQQSAMMGRPGPQNGVSLANQPQRAQLSQPQSFQQLAPQIQQKVNSMTFILPPAISKEQTDGWLPEAKLRYGWALQKQEIGKAKLAELRQAIAQRQSTGSLTPEETQEFKNRQATAERIYREGSDFLAKFKEQQELFKAQQQNQQLNNRQAGQGMLGPAQTGKGEPASTDGARPQTGAGPPPHTINSAVVAARHQAGQATLPTTTSQPAQIPSQAQNQLSGAVPQSQPQSQSQQPQHPTNQNSSSQQAAYGQQASQQDGSSTPVTAAPLPNPQGPPRPLSQQAAMAQSAQSYSNAANQPSSAQAGNPHAHPPGYLASRGDGSARNINMAIPKNLNVQSPEPVTMGAARPTLSGGPSHGTMGVMGQPAIQKHPGYVLEGEGQRVLSKKMLDVLVRQVTGGGEGEGLTPEAEEVWKIFFSG
jgi:transcription initiation factor TFIID subunit 12